MGSAGPRGALIRGGEAAIQGPTGARGGDRLPVAGNWLSISPASASASQEHWAPGEGVTDPGAVPLAASKHPSSVAR